MKSPISEDILEREREFFDRESKELDDRSLIMQTSTIDRYRHARMTPYNIPKDTLFALIMPLAGKRVLDYACGAGENACLLAACGAEVTGFDLSPVSVERARRRAELMGLASRARFDVYPAGEANYPSGSFDIIVGFAALHHLHQALDRVYEEINRLLAPGGTAYFIEPVANNLLLRKLRRLVPVALDATPDEQQLQYQQLEQLTRHGFTHVEYQHYYCLERLHRVLGGRMRRQMRWLDYYLLRTLPFLRPFYGILLVTARRN